MSHRDLISFGKSSLQPTSSWHSFSSLIVPAGAQVGTGPQEPSSAGAVLCPCTGSRLAAQAGDTQGDSHSKPSANAAWQQHLAPAGALQGWAALDLGNVAGQHLEGLVDDPVEDVPVCCRGWTRWPLKILSNPNYSMKSQNISLQNSGIKPTLWI